MPTSPKLEVTTGTVKSTSVIAPAGYCEPNAADVSARVGQTNGSRRTRLASLMRRRRSTRSRTDRSLRLRTASVIPNYERRRARRAVAGELADVSSHSRAGGTATARSIKTTKTTAAIPTNFESRTPVHGSPAYAVYAQRRPWYFRLLERKATNGSRGSVMAWTKDMNTQIDRDYRRSLEITKRSRRRTPELRPVSRHSKQSPPDQRHRHGADDDPRIQLMTHGGRQ
ncbi:hypothetical protein EVAR_44544_1 [Eumeta japonica]|uniref:Uncharacterized protein n=1 Tax=Eumeta variegata TaxID=151549 RepID=A0A4C1X7V0_EUMVA|nr:hypothetical protein EVAR_44544_1 [Eumeta japonica]